jgi:AcrR family transcriptional regulator
MSTRLPAAERRQMILITARRLFAQQGYRSTTTRDIARAVGVSDALLYTYFATKQEVLDAILQEGLEQFAQMPTFDISLPLRTLLQQLGMAFLRVITDQRDFFVLVVSEHQYIVQDGRFAQFLEYGAQQFAHALEQRVVQGEVRVNTNGYLVARQFMGALVAYTILQESLGMQKLHPLDAHQYLSQLIETTLQGIAEGI